MQKYVPRLNFLHLRVDLFISHNTVVLTIDLNPSVLRYSHGTSNFIALVRLTVVTQQLDFDTVLHLYVRQHGLDCRLSQLDSMLEYPIWRMSQGLLLSIAFHNNVLEAEVNMTPLAVLYFVSTEAPDQPYFQIGL